MVAYDVALRGRLVLPGQVLEDGLLLVREGRIVGITRGDEAVHADELIDVRGSWILPGAVDAHVHSGSAGPVAAGMPALTCAAACGGVTTVIDMPYDAEAPVVDADRLRGKAKTIAGRAYVDVALFGTVRKADGTPAIPGMVREGACGFKMSTYETSPDRFPRIGAGDITKAFRLLRGARRVIAFHAEDGEIIDPLVEELRQLPHPKAEMHCQSRPEVAELTSVAELLELARAAQAKLHIVHLTVPRGFDMIAAARLDGVDATAETCLHYLVLGDERMPALGGFGKVNPPLRSPRTQDLLWRKVLGGEVDFITTDHVAWPLAMKSRPNIFDNASGLPGVELLMPLFYSEAVHRRGMDMQRFVRLISSGPSSRYGLFPRKGALAVGSDADVVILDPDDKWTIQGGELHDGAGWSPYEGIEVTGRVTRTLLGGRTVYDHRAGLRGDPLGRFVPVRSETVADPQEV